MPFCNFKDELGRFWLYLEIFWPFHNTNKNTSVQWHLKLNEQTFCTLKLMKITQSIQYIITYGISLQINSHSKIYHEGHNQNCKRIFNSQVGLCCPNYLSALSRIVWILYNKTYIFIFLQIDNRWDHGDHGGTLSIHLRPYQLQN